MKSKIHQSLALIVTAITSVWFASSALASPPYVNYQGTINDATGTPVNNQSQSLEFNIYDAATGGTKVWGPFSLTAPVLNGRFNVILGPADTASRPLDRVFDSGANLYLEVKVGTATIAPRQQFLANPYAYSASSLANLGFQITPDRFDVDFGRRIHFGKGWPLTAEGTGTIGLDISLGALSIIGGGPTPDAQMTVIRGNLIVAPSGGGGSSVTIFGTADITGSVKTPSLITSKDRVISTTDLADLSATFGGIRIIRGRVSAIGDTLDGTGFTCLPPSQSNYQLTFNPPFSGPPVVTVTTVEQSSSRPGIATYSSPTANSVKIRTWRGTDKGDLEFSFIAIGPK